MQVLKNKIQTIKKEYYELRMLLRTALLFLSDTPVFRVSDKAFPSQRHDRPESATRARRVSDTGKRVPAHFFYSFINT